VPHPIVAAAPPASPESPAPPGIPAPGEPSAVPDTPPPSENSQETRSHETSPHYERQMNRVWGWVSVAIGTESLGLAVATSVMMLHQNDLRKQDCTDKVCSVAGINANKEIDSLAPWNVGAWVLAAAGLGVGTFLLLSNPSDKELGVQVGVSPGGMLVRGAF
jgi:hypothetical protein